MWHSHINSRLKAHMNNNSTMPLFGLVNAMGNDKHIGRYTRKDNAEKNISLTVV